MSDPEIPEQPTFQVQPQPQPQPLPGYGAGFPPQIYGQQPYSPPPPYGQVPAGRGQGRGDKTLIFVLVGVLVAAAAGIGIFFATRGSGSTGATGVQLSSRQLAHALLPASAFGSGYTADALQLGTAPSTSLVDDATCMVMLGDIDISNSVSSAMDPGASAQAAVMDTKPDPGTHTGVSFAQSIEQFPGAPQAAALMSRMASLFHSCSASSVGNVSVTVVSTNLGIGDQSIEAQTTGFNPTVNVAVGSRVVVVRKGQDIYEAVLLFGAGVGVPRSPALATVINDLAADVAKQ